jgi:hypothetical protein
MNLSDIKKDAGSWSKDKAWSWYKKYPLIVGFNYVPSTAVNSTEFFMESTYDKKTIQKELGWAKKYGYNSIRFFLPFIVWKEDSKKFIQRMNDFLDLCHHHQLHAIPVLFDDCAFADLEPYLGKQNEPKPLTHNSGWTPSPGKTYTLDISKYQELEQYVNEVVGNFREDERVLMWDLYNEPGNNQLGSRSLFLLEKAFEWARKVKPVQPLTTGVWSLTNYAAEKDTKFNCYRAVELSDIITYHQYDQPINMEKFIVELEEIGYPLICTEWMARYHFDCRIENVLPIFINHQVGSIHWGFVNGKTQTHIPWGWNLSSGEPPIWFHDVLKEDGSPYMESEMVLIKNKEIKI